MKTYLQFFLKAIEQIKEVQKTSLRDKNFTDPFEIFAMLPHPSGKGSFFCGSAAYETLRRASQAALKNSRKLAQIDQNEMFYHVRGLFSDWYLGGKKEISANSSEQLMKEAIRLASSSIVGLTHIYPVHLGHAGGIDEFAIGPVNFVGGNKKDSVLKSYIRNYKTSNQKNPKLIEDLSDDCEKYYSSFGWIAIIDVEPCSEKISNRHGQKMVQDALNCINVLLGQHYSCHMVVGGPQFANDRRSSLSIDGSGKVELSSSTDWLGHALGEVWWDVINKDGGREILRLMGVTIREGNHLGDASNLSMRILDAMSWYGEAVRDRFAPSSIVKFTTSLERLLITKKTSGNLKHIFEERAAAFVYSATGGSLEEIKNQFSQIYRLRSDLVHGKTTPNSTEIIRSIYNFDRYVRIAIQQYIYIARDDGVARNTTYKQLEDWMNKVVDAAKRISKTAKEGQDEVQNSSVD